MKPQGIVRLVSVAAALATWAVAGGVPAGASPVIGSSEQSAARPAGSNVKGTISLLEGGSNDFSDGDVVEFVDLLRQEGYKVNVNVIEDSATALRAVVANRADFFIGDPSEVILADANGGAHIKLLAANDQSSNYELLALPRFTLHNLKGATLGIAAPGTTTQVIVEAALKAEGVNPQIVKYVDIGGTSARITAILSGEIDLAPALATSAIPALATGKVKLLINTGPVLGAYLQGGLIANDNYIAKNPATVQAVVDALINAERWANTHEQGYVSLMDKAGLSSGLTASEQKAAWLNEKTSKFHAVNGGICPSYIAHSLKLDEETGSITAKQALAQSVWLDTTFVRKYLQQHGQSPTAC